jgi:hypothetical protein
VAHVHDEPLAELRMLDPLSDAVALVFLLLEVFRFRHRFL